MTGYCSDKIKTISFFSILLVVFLHSFNLENAPEVAPLLNKSWIWFVEDLISYGFTRIAVPLFFLLSGYLFFLNTRGSFSELKAKIRKRGRTLLVPFLFWSLSGIAFYFILQSVPQTAAFFTKEHIVDFSFKKWLFTIFITPIPYQLWFIRDLMVLVLASPLLFFGIKNFWKLALLLPVILWIVATKEFQNSAEALLFFVAGGIISFHKPEILAIRYKSKTPLLTAAWICLVGLKTALLYFDVSQILIIAVYKLSIILGVAAFWGLYDLFSENRGEEKGLQGNGWFGSITGYTFFIFAAHEPMLTVYKKVLFVALGKQPVNYIEVYFIAPVATILSCLVLGIILKKYLTILYEAITGGR